MRSPSGFFINKDGITIIYRYKPYRKQIELVVFWGRQNPQKRPG